MKNYVLFGAGHVAEKKMGINPKYIVDNNVDMQGDDFFGLSVESPDILRDRTDELSIIICTTSISEVRQQLESYGYKWGVNISSADELEEMYEISLLEEEKFEFLISCGLPSTAESFSGGGIYHIQETGSYPKINKVYEGNTHGLIKVDDDYVFTCQGKGIVVVDNKFDVKRVIALRPGLRPHGIKKYNDLYVLVCSNKDSILAVSESGEEIFEYKLSNKMERFLSPQHHCNDLEVIGDYAYVSMFSVTGNWKRNSFDGGIVEIDLITGDSRVVRNDLLMPHNINYCEQGLVVLNSFKGSLLTKNFEVQATLPGFLRGFDFNDKYYFLGESKNRNFSRLSTGRTPVSIDTKVTIMNRKFGFCRSIYLPSPISEVHSIVNIPTRDLVD